MKWDCADELFIIFVFLALFLFIGDPDLMDGFIKMANK